MTDDQLIKAIQNAVKTEVKNAVKAEVRPLKEQIEIVRSKVDKLDLFQSLATNQIRNIKDQLSVVNEKLDTTKEEIHLLKDDLHQVKEDLHQVKEDLHQVKEDLHQVKEDLHQVKEDLHQVKEDLHQVKDLQDNSIYPSVIYIEKVVKGYGDAYKINDSNTRKLEKRVVDLEDFANIQPSHETILVDIE